MSLALLSVTDQLQSAFCMETGLALAINMVLVIVIDKLQC